MNNFMVGRQPVFDADFKVRGYELLFRGGTSPRPGGDAMTADVLVHAGLDLGLEGLVGTKLAFVNATRSFLVGDNELPLPPGQTVVEILEGVPRDDEVVAGCRRLVQAGYTLAMDDYVFSESDDPLLEFVSIIKLDVLALTPAELESGLKRCSALGMRPLAEKVETPEQLDACQELGFDLYQGYLLSRPEVVEGNALTPSRLTCLRIIEKLCNPATSAREIEGLVQTDAALSYRFLRAASAGAARGLYRQVRSVREGVVLLGQQRLRSWVTLMLLADDHPGAEEQLHIAMTRARMAELMAAILKPRAADTAFTVGLVSALDLLLRANLSDVLSGLALAGELEEALVNRTGFLGRILSDVLSWELGGGALQFQAGLDLAGMEKVYIEALMWANEVCQVLDVK
jgi:EAL and modified HD-GYP domain-containing signal transduction protein